MNPYFSLDDKVYDIIEKNPKARTFLISNGFKMLENEIAFNTLAKKVTLRTALSMQKVNPELFAEKLISYLDGENRSVDKDLLSPAGQEADIMVEGVLPCPIRVPLMENFTAWLDEKKDELGYSIGYDLKSANLGLDDVIEKVKQGNPDLIPDVLISAGYELFFDKKLMGRYLDENLFEAASDNFNSDFACDRIDLRDPMKKYLIIGVVPAVFIVNKKVLNGRPVPRTWDELLSDAFTDSVAIPMGDLDMFNALVVSLYARYGMDGITRLARIYKKSLHPAQMVKGKGGSPSLPAVSITPYFFSQMVQPGGDQEVVWPEDGAIISPIFMMSKTTHRQKVQPVIDYFMSRQVGEIFSSNGKFPSTNPQVDNHLSPDQTFWFVGWDFIHNTDIGALLKELEAHFNREIGLTDKGGKP